MKNDYIFALDIGTRKIMGLVMQKSSSAYNILGSKMIEHSTRAMLDGQIHDVEAVASTIGEIKNILEESLDIKLESAAVAAAGRALKTARGSVYKKRTVLNEISREEVRALEIEAVQQAQYLLAQDELAAKEKNKYFCVGYSIISYHLEDQEIGSLVGQVANEVSVEVIATFLPRVVVDSLFSSLKRCGLEVYSLTLEPIAAISLAIPPEMRILNLALVDIGAGTSDIAIIKNNNIFAYAMVPQGGDKLTESIASRYLLDFNHAEEIKRLLNSREEVELVDILGNKSLVSSSEIKESMQEVSEQLIGNIAENILSLNQNVPDAVICVGGGSQAPDFTVLLADKLGIPKSRVGIRTPESSKLFNLETDYLKGPQGITPLGIAFYSFNRPPIPFVKVKVNERELALWNMGELTVGTALLSSGISLAAIYGRPGMGKTIEVNGELQVIKGGVGSPPQIKVNGETAFLESEIKEGDQIIFSPGKNGDDACITLLELIPLSGEYVFVNGEKIELQPQIKVNGSDYKIDKELPDRAKIEYQQLNRVDKIIKLAGLSEYYLSEQLYRYYLNGQKMFLKWIPVEVYINGIRARLNQTVAPASEITYSINKLRPVIRDILNDIGELNLQVKVNGETVILEDKGAVVEMDGQSVELDKEIDDGARIFIDKTKSNAILSDIFKVVEIEAGRLSSKLSMKVDGKAAGFTTPIANNSEIELIWE